MKIDFLSTCYDKLDNTSIMKVILPILLLILTRILKSKHHYLSFMKEEIEALGVKGVAK